MSANKTKPARAETAVRVLLFDIESSPNVGYTWGKFEQNVIEFIKERQIICFAWQWLGENEIGARCLADFPGYRRNPDDNRALVVELHRLMSKADVIVGHNIDRFDDKRANTDFIKHNLPPPPPHKTIDTLKIARSQFAFNSNRLGDLGSFLGVGAKVRHSGFDLWRRCMSGDSRAWQEMKRYNRGDVRLLRRIYLKERPWIKNHPNLTAKDPEYGCPNCGAKGDKIVRNGQGINKFGIAQRFLCKGCGKRLVGAYVKDRWRFS